ncbi:MAG: cysteine synthase A [Kiritimatiellia bacterium]
MSSYSESIGQTPYVRLAHLAENIFAKHEARNGSYSVKDRVALNMVLAAEAAGSLRKGMAIVEPTSGNTGIGLAAVAAARGYRAILTMPETMSLERRKVLASLGAEVVLTPGSEGMKGAIAKAEQLRDEKPGEVFIPGQFTNPANPDAHYKTTGPEIWEQSGGKVDVLIAGVGTGGTISGAGRYLRERKPEIELIAVEPDESPVISQFLAGEPLRPGPHKIQGIGAGFIPKTLDTSILSRVIRVPGDAAIETARKVAREEGLFVGISSGAAAWAALQLGETYARKHIAVIFPDGGERYLSIW